MRCSLSPHSSLHTVSLAGSDSLRQLHLHHTPASISHPIVQSHHKISPIGLAPVENASSHAHSMARQWHSCVSSLLSSAGPIGHDPLLPRKMGHGQLVEDPHMCLTVAQEPPLLQHATKPAFVHMPQCQMAFRPQVVGRRGLFLVSNCQHSGLCQQQCSACWTHLHITHCSPGGNWDMGNLWMTHKYSQWRKRCHCYTSPCTS